MAIALVTGSAGLIGSQACRYFAARGMDVVGIDNDLRRQFFGPEASTLWQRQRLEAELGRRYRHCGIDIRCEQAVERLFREVGRHIELIIHAAAQPSHDWAARSRKSTSASTPSAR